MTQEMNWEPGCRCAPCVRAREAYVHENKIAAGVQVRFPLSSKEPRFRVWTVKERHPSEALWALEDEAGEITYLSEVTLKNPKITKLVEQ